MNEIEQIKMIKYFFDQDLDRNNRGLIIAIASAATLSLVFLFWLVVTL